MSDAYSHTLPAQETFSTIPTHLEGVQQRQLVCAQKQVASGLHPLSVARHNVVEEALRAARGKVVVAFANVLQADVAVNAQMVPQSLTGGGPVTLPFGAVDTQAERALHGAQVAVRAELLQHHGDLARWTDVK